MAAKSAFAWWTNELRSLVPSNPGVRNEETEVARLRRVSGVWQIDGGPNSQLEIASEPNPVELCLPREAVVFRKVSLAARDRRSIWEIVADQIEGLSPWPPESVAYDIFESGRTADQVQYKIAITPRATIEEARAFAEERGFALRSAVIESNDGVPCAFRVEQFEGHGRSTGRVLLAVATVVAIWVGSFAAIGAVQGTQISALEAQEAEWRVRLSATADPSAKVAAVKSTRLAAQRLASQTLSSDMLAELTARIPDDVVLFSLRRSGSEVEISGFAKDASRLLAALKSSPLIQDVRYAAAIERREASAPEKFTIEVDLK